MSPAFACVVSLYPEGLTSPCSTDNTVLFQDSFQNSPSSFTTLVELATVPFLASTVPWIYFAYCIQFNSVAFLSNTFCTLSGYNNAGLTMGSIKYKWNKGINVGKAANSLKLLLASKIQMCQASVFSVGNSEK